MGTGKLKDWARAIKQDVHAIYLAARDPRVPWYAKALALCVAGYALSPIDLIPDFIPVIGYLDDLIIVPIVLGIYRKSHIPDGPGYQEKYYFRPGDTGFKSWTTKPGRIGAGICWDQWYPEAARAMVLHGAEILLYPTAIGSEPYDLSLDTHRRWQRVMEGHAVANAVPVIAANRIGEEVNDGVSQCYYGHSFIADHTGEIVASFGESEEGAILHSFDLGEIVGHGSLLAHR